jgi:hypothetical protein
MFLCLQPVTTLGFSHGHYKNLLKLALRLEWPALVRFIDTKVRRFTFISRKYGEDPFPLVLFKVPFSTLRFGVLTETVNFLFAYLFPQTVEV